jgi:hypothetical protein
VGHQRPRLRLPPPPPPLPSPLPPSCALHAASAGGLPAAAASPPAALRQWRMWPWPVGQLARGAGLRRACALPQVGALPQGAAAGGHEARRRAAAGRAPGGAAALAGVGGPPLEQHGGAGAGRSRARGSGCRALGADGTRARVHWRAPPTAPRPCRGRRQPRLPACPVCRRSRKPRTGSCACTSCRAARRPRRRRRRRRRSEGRRRGVRALYVEEGGGRGGGVLACS